MCHPVDGCLIVCAASLLYILLHANVHLMRTFCVGLTLRGIYPHNWFQFHLSRLDICNQLHPSIMFLVVVVAMVIVNNSNLEQAVHGL